MFQAPTQTPESFRAWLKINRELPSAAASACVSQDGKAHSQFVTLDLKEIKQFQSMNQQHTERIWADDDDAFNNDDSLSTSYTLLWTLHSTIKSQ